MLNDSYQPLVKRAEGRYSDAYIINWRSNVFPGILGRTCDRPCEPACRRTRVDGTPVAICRLKRVAADHRDEVKDRLPQAPAEKNGKRVALIGAGPASLTVANDLMPLGYQVTVFEKMPKLGGLMRTNIPSFRLPAEVLDEEIGYITDMGVDVRYNTPVNSLKALLDSGEYDAVFVGSGAPKGKELDIPGRHETDQIFIGIEWLESIHFGHVTSVGEKVIIIGVGNTAMDCCRTSARLGGKDIKVMARKPRAFFKASPWELEDAEEERVEIVVNHEPTAFVLEDGRLVGMRFRRFESTIDEKGKLSQAAMDKCMSLITPTLDYNDIADCDLVIESVVENLAVKKELFAELAEVVQPDAVLATNLGVHLKRSREDSLVWVTELDSARPVGDAEVVLMDCSGNELARGRTDREGIWKGPVVSPASHYCDKPSGRGVYAFAKKGDDFSFVNSEWGGGIERWRFNMPGEHSSEENGAHTVLARTLLRAGETVQRAVHPLVVRTLDDEGRFLLANADRAWDGAVQRTLGALHRDGAVSDGDVDATGDGDGCFTDTGHVRSSFSPHVAEDFAADLALARFTVGHESLTGGQDGHTEATEHTRNLVALAVDPQAGGGDATQTRDRATTILRVLHRDGEHVARTRGGRSHSETFDVTLLLEDSCECDLLLGCGHTDLVVHRRVGVADSGEHVCDGISQHLLLLTSSPW